MVIIIPGGIAGFVLCALSAGFFLRGRMRGCGSSAVNAASDSRCWANWRASPKSFTRDSLDIQKTGRVASAMHAGSRLPAEMSESKIQALRPFRRKFQTVSLPDGG